VHDSETVVCFFGDNRVHVQTQSCLPIYYNDAFLNNIYIYIYIYICMYVYMYIYAWVEQRCTAKALAASQALVQPHAHNHKHMKNIILMCVSGKEIAGGIRQLD